MALEHLGCTCRADGGATIRVLIDPGSYRTRNIGDAAMLQVALGRLRSYWPRAAIQIRSPDVESVDDYLNAVQDAHLVLMSGSDTLCDAFKRDAFCRLEALELAIGRGAVTALVGQSVGPMSNGVLRALASRILPHVDFIAVRDSINSLSLLNDIGVETSRINITGDDAIEIAYRARQETRGSEMGLHLHVAGYSSVDEVTKGKAIVRQAADRLRAPLRDLPIATCAEQDDLCTARQILSAEAESNRVPASPDVLCILPECRMVVSGSYHVAVFALSMGIPVIGIAACDYYVHKFRGLAHQFGPAFQVELTSHPDFHARLHRAIHTAWELEPGVRQSLLRAAVRQVAEGKAAYRRLFTQVEGRRASRLRIMAGS